MDLDKPQESAVTTSKIHFGSLAEGEEKKLAQGIHATRTEPTQHTSVGEYLPFSETTLESQKKSDYVLQEWEAKKKAKSILIPTDDKLVQARLRELGEPIILFGEGPVERGERLRRELSKRGLENAMPTTVVKGTTSAAQDVQDEIFYTEGSKELKQARLWLVKYSLTRARDRLAKEKKENPVVPEQPKSENGMDVDSNSATTTTTTTTTAAPATTTTTVQPTKTNGNNNNNNNNNSNSNEMALDGETKKKRTIHEWQKTFEFFTNTSSQVGDERPLGFCRLSPDNKTLATAGWSGLVKLWDVDSCAEKFSFKGHADRANCVIYHPFSGTQQSESSVNLASCGADGVVNLWSLNSNSALNSFKGHTAKVNRVAFHPSGRFLGSTGDDLTWKLYDIEVGKEILDQEGHSRAVFGISFQADGSLVATGGTDKIARVWDLRSGKSIWVVKGHSKRILDIDWSPNGHLIATASEDNSVHISDLRTKRLLYLIPAHQNLVSHVRFIESGELLFTSSFDHTCKIFSTRDWSPVRAIGGNEKIMCCDLSSDFTKLITANYDRTWRVFVKDKVAWERESVTRK